MFSRGKGMGGGAPGGINMLRTVGRAAVATARAGVTTANPSTFQEPLPSSPSSPTSASQRQNNSNTYLYISSAINSTGVPISANSNWPTFAAASPASSCDDFEWASLDGIEEDKPPNGVFDDFVLGPAPSVGEVQNAVSALQWVFDASSCPQLIRDKFSYNAGKDKAYQIPSPTGSEIDWVEPSLHLCNQVALQSHGLNGVYSALHLLETEPMVQKMVFSLASDEAVWNAVLKNKVVRELRELYHAAEDNNNLPSCEGSSYENSKAASIVKWIFDNTKAKVIDTFEKIIKVVNDLFKLSPDNETTTTTGNPDPFEERLRTSYLLSVFIVLVVVVTRSHTA